MGADMSRSVLVNLELIGLRAPARRLRPVAAGPFALVSLVVALLPIRPAGLWLAAVVACNVLPWLLGLRETRPGRWRLSARGWRRWSGRGGVGSLLALALGAGWAGEGGLVCGWWLLGGVWARAGGVA